MVFHPAWGCFASAYGWQQIPVDVEGKEPGPQTLARLIDAARRAKVRVVFVQKTPFSKTAAVAVARGIGGEVPIDLLAEDSMGNICSTPPPLSR